MVAKALKSDGLNIQILFEAQPLAHGPGPPTFVPPDEPLSVVGVDPGQRDIFTATRGALLLASLLLLCLAHRRQDLRNAVWDLVRLVELEMTLRDRFPRGALPLPFPHPFLIEFVRSSRRRRAQRHPAAQAGLCGALFGGEGGASEERRGGGGAHDGRRVL